MKDQDYFEEKNQRFEDSPKAFDNNLIFVAISINMQNLTGAVFLNQLAIYRPLPSNTRTKSWSDKHLFILPL